MSGACSLRTMFSTLRMLGASLTEAPPNLYTLKFSTVLSVQSLLGVGILEVRHFDSGIGTFDSFISEFASCTVECLLSVEGSEDAENDRRQPMQVEFRYPVRDTLADIIEMGGVALNDASDDDDGIVESVSRCVSLTLGSRISQFDSTRHMQHFDVVLFDPVFD